MTPAVLDTVIVVELTFDFSNQFDLLQYAVYPQALFERSLVDNGLAFTVHLPGEFFSPGNGTAKRLDELVDHLVERVLLIVVENKSPGRLFTLPGFLLLQNIHLHLRSGLLLLLLHLPDRNDFLGSHDRAI